MKITLTVSGGEVYVCKETEGHRFVEVPVACACGSELVGGTGKQIENRDTYRAEALCGKCREPRGVLRAQVETVFGLEEDERVLAGPWRVY